MRVSPSDLSRIINSCLNNYIKNESIRVMDNLPYIRNDICDDPTDAKIISSIETIIDFYNFGSELRVIYTKRNKSEDLYIVKPYTLYYDLMLKNMSKTSALLLNNDLICSLDSIREAIMNELKKCPNNGSTYNCSKLKLFRRYFKKSAKRISWEFLMCNIYENIAPFKYENAFIVREIEDDILNMLELVESYDELVELV
jgi:hypothetical protein